LTGAFVAWARERTTAPRYVAVVTANIGRFDLPASTM
jgi:hypothetical protein